MIIRDVDYENSTQSWVQTYNIPLDKLSENGFMTSVGPRKSMADHLPPLQSLLMDDAPQMDQNQPMVPIFNQGDVEHELPYERMLSIPGQNNLAIEHFPSNEYQTQDYHPCLQHGQSYDCTSTSYM